MKMHTVIPLAMATVLAVAVQANQEQLASSIKEARVEATRAADQLKAALDSVNALTKQTEGDLRPAYNKFAAEVPRTEAAASWTRARVQWMASDGRGYFESWQKTINSLNNDSLRKKAQKRLDTARKNYDKVEVALRSAADQFNPFLSDLSDIQKILSKDVTPGGVKAVKGTVKSANWRYQTVKTSVDRALKEMQKMEKELAPEAK